MSFTLRFPPHGKWKWNCLCHGKRGRGLRDSGRLWKVPGKCIKFSFVQLRQRLSKLWRRASRSRSLAWPGLVWPWLGCSQSTWQTRSSTTTTTTTACWNFYEDAGVESSWVEFLGGCRHLNFAALHETYSFWGNFKCHKLLTPVVRRLKLSKTLVRVSSPPLSVSPSVSAIINSGSIGCNWAST